MMKVSGRVVVIIVFFFQAEDGIRDLVRSRGGSEMCIRDRPEQTQKMKKIGLSRLSIKRKKLSIKKQNIASLYLSLIHI